MDYNIRTIIVQKTIFALLFIFILNHLIAAKDVTHLVQKGETLYSISRLYNVSLDEILVANKIEDSSKIKVGYNLIIPSKTAAETKTIAEKKEYKVQKGDTLYSVAKSNNVNINDLLSENNFNKDTVIKVGQIIKIPGTEVAKGKTSPPVSSPDAGNNTGNSYSQHYWPVKGEMEKLSGKLQGSKISAKYGDPVYSVSSGKVVWEGPYRGFGRVIFIESVSGYIYVYGGNDKTNVIVGDSVEPGFELGKIGLNVHENKPTMFFAVYNKDGKPIDVEKAPRI